jgi:hypothetical protein
MGPILGSQPIRELHCAAHCSLHARAPASCLFPHRVDTLVFGARASGAQNPLYIFLVDRVSALPPPSRCICTKSPRPRICRQELRGI